MTKINKFLKENNLESLRFEKRGKVTIIDTNKGKYVYKEKTINNNILAYLKSRHFDYLPDIIKNDDYNVSRYIEKLDIPDEQKIIDLIKLTALLHSKTTHYKEVDKNYYEEIYNNIDNNLNYLYSYYTDLITIIESKVFPSPSEQLLSRNISMIYNTISDVKKRLDSWHELIKEKTKERNVILHGNLKLDHFIRNENSYFISWDKSKIGLPIFDIYKLYQNHASDFDFESLLEIYEKNYPLTKDEKELFRILICTPDVIDLKGNEYDKCKKISRTINKIYRSEKLVSPKTSK